MRSVRAGVRWSRAAVMLPIIGRAGSRSGRSDGLRAKARRPVVSYSPPRGPLTRAGRAAHDRAEAEGPQNSSTQLPSCLPLLTRRTRRRLAPDPGLPGPPPVRARMAEDWINPREKNPLPKTAARANAFRSARDAAGLAAREQREKRGSRAPQGVAAMFKTAKPSNLRVRCTLCLARTTIRVRPLRR